MPHQEGWRWCSLCSVLYYGPNANGHCPASNNGPHNPNGSGDYSVSHNDKIHDTNHQQENWRWCSHCANLHFAPEHGHCIRGAPHNTDGSGHYILAHQAVPDHAQAGWKWCKNCSSLFFPGTTGGVCARGGKHDPTGSGNYAVHHKAHAAGHGQPAPTQQTQQTQQTHTVTTHYPNMIVTTTHRT
eukprot:TRINITY_DN2580_c0_g1_i1.p1 TRINITY_DN2580_c0_g1~~TRINITY_DN2580_c0_g1_i1.p1  ORF type:complete len:196 (-),score=41.25 TRINITY_DN2580_c0_g1_i1:46-600(-)